jgi:hypothetical protein
MASLSGARELYILDRAPSTSPFAVAVPDTTGIPTVIESKFALLRVAYLPADFAPEQFENARSQLSSAECSLFAHLGSPDGSPSRSGIVFEFGGLRLGISWLDGTDARHGASARYYQAATIFSPSSWRRDWTLGRVGYFLTGHSEEANLWRVSRVEPDALERLFLTLVPIQRTPSLPSIDFAIVADPDRRLELVGLYNDFCERVVQNAYRDVPTKARNIVEGMVTWKLRSQARSVTGRLGDDLNVVKRLLNDPQNRATCGWDDLEYTLANKIRLVHARTHLENAVANLPLRPEFGLSVVQDLRELLVIWGCMPA